MLMLMGAGLVLPMHAQKETWPIALEMAQKEGDATMLTPFLQQFLPSDSVDVLGEMMRISCRHGLPWEYQNFINRHQQRLFQRTDLWEQLTLGKKFLRRPPRVEFLMSDDPKADQYLQSFHSTTYHAFYDIRNAWIVAEVEDMLVPLKALLERGWNNSWGRELLAILEDDYGGTLTLLSDSVNTSDQEELMPVLSVDGEQLYFCRHDRWGFEDVYVAERNGGLWDVVEPLEEVNMDGSSEAPLSLSTDGTELLLFVNGKIMAIRQTSEGWSEMQELAELRMGNWNSDAQLVASGEAYLFASEVQSENLDLYVAELTDAGTVDTVYSLGSTINTPYQERTPFMHADMRTLYFASEGHGGLGGLDVFVSKRLADTCWNCWSDPVNMGQWVNSRGLDMGFAMSAIGEEALLSHEGDICRYILPPPVRPEPVAMVHGVVLNCEGKPVGAQVVWEDLGTGEILGHVNADPTTGAYTMVLPNGKHYGYYLRAKGHHSTSSNLDLREANEAMQRVENIELVCTDEETGGLRFAINNVFFDFGSENLTDASTMELQRVAELLLRVGSTRVRLTGHTDDVGDSETNQRLSEQRARSVMVALMNLGVPSEWMSSGGAGESQPLESNETEDGRQKNRRVEVTLWL